MLNMNQTGCRMGGVAFAAGEDLSLKAGYLVKLNAGGDLVLPESDQELAPYVVVQGADQGYLCGAVPVSSAMNCRVKLVGSCNAGELLVANGDGRVKVFTAGSTARPVGTAEETGVAGQLVLVRPLAYGVAGPAGADGAPGAPGADGADGADGQDAFVVSVPYSSITAASKPTSAAFAVGMCVILQNGIWVMAGENTWANNAAFVEGVVLGAESDAAPQNAKILMFARWESGGVLTLLSPTIPLSAFVNPTKAAVNCPVGANTENSGFLMFQAEYTPNCGVVVNSLFVSADGLVLLDSTGTLSGGTSQG